MNTTSTSHLRKTLPAFLLLTAALALSSATVARAATVSNWLALTITNPTPAAVNYFGDPVAVMGLDRLLIGAAQDDTGAGNAGVAYLLSISGALLTTFTNPTPAYEDFFGSSVAAVGPDRVLIGAPNDGTGAIRAGAAYLFSSNGALLTTFTNPAPAYNDFFGSSVAAAGTDRVLIGASGDETSGIDSGGAYLFSTNGALLTSFNCPAPAFAAYFGASVVDVGINQVVIGAPHITPIVHYPGAAYMFSTNGALTTTFTNPSPAANDGFGASVATVGTDRVLIGAPHKSTGASEVGAAYLFSTNGTLLTSFTNPAPAEYDKFGYSLAAVGTDCVLIGTLGAFNSGAAYLFSTNGALLSTFARPTPAIGAYFGSSVTAVGTNRVLIGASGDNTGASGAGAAYLFSLEQITPPAPSLSTSRNPSLSTLTISWPAPAEGWLLESTNALPSVASSSWPPVPPPYQTNAGTISVTFTNQPATGNQFFRLRQP